MSFTQDNDMFIQFHSHYFLFKSALLRFVSEIKTKKKTNNIHLDFMVKAIIQKY